jgi:RNA-directed DNA polymerase
MVTKSADPAVISTRRLCVEILQIHKDELLSLVAGADSYYKPYTQKKKRADGSIKERRIEPSVDYLKSAQRLIDKRILKPAMADLSIEIMGGRPNVSVVNNAKHHAQSKGLMKYDVKNFFPSIKYEHVYHIFRYRLGFCEEAANILTKLTTYPSAGDVHVPQGAPTSTSLAMFALEPMCDRLKIYCDGNGLRSSIWIDDITISGDPEVLRQHRPWINHIVNNTPFQIHPDKDTGVLVKGGKSGHEKGRKITGIVIDNNNRLTIGRQKLRSLRNKVRKSKVFSDKLEGSLQFLRHVNPTQGNKLLREYRAKHKRNAK